MIVAFIASFSQSACVDVSQYGQTTALLNMYNKPSGTFIEFGCADGVQNSNTFMLECRMERGLHRTSRCVDFRKNAYNGAVCKPGQNETQIIVANLDGFWR